jgi:hypothetical protein
MDVRHKRDKRICFFIYEFSLIGHGRGSWVVGRE